MRSLAFPLALPLSLLPALAGGCVDDREVDEPEPPVVTSGAYHHFAQSSWTLPANSSEALTTGFDFDADGTIDNLAGQVIAALSGVGLDVQTESDRALADGDLVILHSLRADELADDASVSWRVLAGVPTAPPRWDGTDIFRVAGEDGSFVGPIVGGRAQMGWGVVNIPLPFFPAQSSMVLPLSEARITAAVTASDCSGTIGGVMLQADIELTLERFARQAITHIERNPEHELARVAYRIFDTNSDGVISVEEMAGSPLAESLFAPDVDLDDDGRNDGLSFGFGFSCEAAQFTVIGELP